MVSASIAWCREERPGGQPGRGQLGGAQLMGTTPLSVPDSVPRANSGNPSEEGLIPKSQQGTDSCSSMSPGQGPQTQSGAQTPGSGPQDPVTPHPPSDVLFLSLFCPPPCLSWEPVASPEEEKEIALLPTGPRPALSSVLHWPGLVPATVPALCSLVPYRRL